MRPASRADTSSLYPTVDKKKHDLYEGVPAMAALCEADKVDLPSSPPDELGGGEEDPRAMVDVLVAEAHGLGREAHDDSVMCWYAGETWLRRYVLAEERRRKRCLHGRAG